MWSPQLSLAGLAWIIATILADAQIFHDAVWHLSHKLAENSSLTGDPTIAQFLSKSSKHHALYRVITEPGLIFSYILYYLV